MNQNSKESCLGRVQKICTRFYQRMINCFGKFKTNPEVTSFYKVGSFPALVLASMVSVIGDQET